MKQEHDKRVGPDVAHHDHDAVRASVDGTFVPMKIGPRDADGLLQPDTLPWGGSQPAMEMPRFSTQARSRRSLEACRFELGRALARAALLQLAEEAVDFAHQAPEAIASEAAGYGGFGGLLDGMACWGVEERAAVQLGVSFELHAFCLAALRGIDVAAVIRRRDLQSINDDFRAVQVNGAPLRDLWQSQPAEVQR